MLLVRERVDVTGKKLSESYGVAKLRYEVFLEASIYHSFPDKEQHIAKHLHYTLWCFVNTTEISSAFAVSRRICLAPHG